MNEDNYEILRDEFAIAFAEWVTCSRTFWTPISELLEMYKREKGYEPKRES
jgi:hypothetical protein